MAVPKVSANMSEEEQVSKLYGKVYKEFDFSKTMGVMALCKELMKLKFDRLFLRTKILFVQRDDKWG